MTTKKTAPGMKGVPINTIDRTLTKAAIEQAARPGNKIKQTNKQP